MSLLLVNCVYSKTIFVRNKKLTSPLLISRLSYFTFKFGVRKTPRAEDQVAFVLFQLHFKGELVSSSVNPMFSVVLCLVARCNFLS